VRAAYLLLVGIAAFFALAAHTPMPTWRFWQLRFAGLEGGLAFAFLGLVGVGLAVWSRAWSPAAVGLISSVVCALPVLTVILAGGPFDPIVYFTRAVAGEVPVRRDVVLDPARPELSVDVYGAPEGEGRPFVVVVHGGSWARGDKGEVEHVSRALAEHGYVVFDVRYRLAPEHPFPAGIADVKCLLGRIREQAAAFGVDPERAALLGRSAGGHMALLSAYSAGDPRLAPGCAVEDRPVKRVIAVYPPVDLAWGHDNPYVPDVIDGPQSMEQYLGGAPDGAAATYELATPLSHLDGAVPTLLLHGGAERLVNPIHSERLAAALRERGVPHEHVVVPFAEHGFDVRAGGAGEQLARARILAFLRDL
jgi:acetyl esterase/lipase